MVNLIKINILKKDGTWQKYKIQKDRIHDYKKSKIDKKTVYQKKRFYFLNDYEFKCKITSPPYIRHHVYSIKKELIEKKGDENVFHDEVFVKHRRYMPTKMIGRKKIYLE